MARQPMRIQYYTLYVRMYEVINRAYVFVLLLTISAIMIKFRFNEFLMTM